MSESAPTANEQPTRDPLDPLTRMTTERDLWRDHYHRTREQLAATRPTLVMSNAPHHIRVWQFEDAPEELRNLSTNGGDEDWVALVPPRLRDTYISWLEPGRWGFGVCCVDRYEHPELPEYTVYIGCHA